jgi:hypothetical protein
VRAARHVHLDPLGGIAGDMFLAALLDAGDEASLRSAWELRPDSEPVLLALAELLARRAEPGDGDEALALLDKLPQTAEVRRVAALARTGGAGAATGRLCPRGAAMSAPPAPLAPDGPLVTVRKFSAVAHRWDDRLPLEERLAQASAPAAWQGLGR